MKRASKKPGHPKYAIDWARLFDGSPWEVTVGEDFTTSIAQAATHIRAMAAYRGLRVSVVRMDDQTLRVESKGPVANAEATP